MEETEKKQFTIRIDKSLFEEIEKISKEQNRNTNGQIEYLLKKAIELMK